VTTWHCHDCFHGMPEAATAGGIAVVIDVLRASTTIVRAVASGANAVVPTAEIDEARRIAASLGPAGMTGMTGGERGGVRIEGFDLGNSPLEYTPDRVAGKTVVITTTNGTAALAACHDAAAVLIGAVVNRGAVGKAARAEAGRLGAAVHLVCAGTDGHVTDEDLLGAGAILDAAALPGDVLDEAAARALARYRGVVRNLSGADRERAIAEAFAASHGGRNLLALGMEADLPAAAAIDSLDVVPLLDRESGTLTARSRR